MIVGGNMMLTEKIVNTEEYAGCCDLITGIKDFKSQVEYIEDLYIKWGNNS